MKTKNTILKILTFRIVVCLIVVSPVTAVSQNLVTNSGFSAGATGWSTACSIEINPETAYGGSNSSNLTTEIDVERCINQDICILPGLAYTFSFKAGRRTQAQTVAAPGMTFTVTGLTTATKYINTSKTYTNTVFSLKTEAYNFTIPAGSADRKVRLAFADYNNTGTYGVILDDIQLAPVAGSTLSVNGADILSPGLASAWSVNNATSSIAGYAWSFGSTANQPASSLAAPTGIQWSATGNNTVSVALSNGSCTVATLSKVVYIINGILAVELTHFTGSANSNGNQLDWSAGNEASNLYFIVERSVNGIGFDSIGVVPAVNNGRTQHYSFTDNSYYGGSNYYRLCQVDRDGACKNSATIVIENNSSVKPAFHLFPNPAISVICYQLNNSTATTVSVQVLNASGTVLLSKKQSLAAGNNQYIMDISSLGAGMYFLKIATETGILQPVQPFCKTR